MRLNFELPEQRVNELKALQLETESESMKELFNSAITTLEWLVQETKNGNEIAAINEDRKVYRVFVTPVLGRVAKKRQRQLVPAGAGH
jgi:hypothetical protein